MSDAIKAEGLMPGQKVKYRYTEDGRADVVEGVLVSDGGAALSTALACIRDHDGELLPEITLLEVHNPTPFDFLDYEDLTEVVLVDSDGDQYEVEVCNGEYVSTLQDQPLADHVKTFGPVKFYRTTKTLLATVSEDDLGLGGDE